MTKRVNSIFHITYNVKQLSMNAQLLAKRINLKYIEISEESELIEMISLDCTASTGV